MSQFGIIMIEGTKYDLDDLTLDEIEALEEAAGGVPFSEINYGSSKGMRAFTYVLMKRENSELTLADVGSVKLVTFAAADEDTPELPPASGASEETPPNESGQDVSGAQDFQESTGG